MVDPLYLYAAIFIFVIGICIGSFLNVVIYRLPVMLQSAWRKEATLILDGQECPGDSSDEKFNLAVPASTCGACGQKIKPWHNIPVVGYFLIGGKCANCKSRISLRYPLVEFSTGLVSLLLFAKFGLSLEFAFLLFFTYCLIPLIGIDFDHKLLPDSITLPLLWLGLLVNVSSLYVNLPSAVYGAAFGYLSLWSIFWLFKLTTGKEGMGYGDFKLMAAVGAWFGWQILPSVILMSSVLGALFGIVQMFLAGKSEDANIIPYGPFIATAAWLLVVFPEINIFFKL